MPILPLHECRCELCGEEFQSLAKDQICWYCNQASDEAEEREAVDKTFLAFEAMGRKLAQEIRRATDGDPRSCACRGTDSTCEQCDGSSMYDVK